MRANPENLVAIFPGSFDPVTSGHLDLIERGVSLFDRVIVSVSRNANKVPLFSMAERIQMLRETLSHLPGVEVASFEGLVVEFAAAQGARVLLRGIRAIADYEYELQMATMNAHLAPRIETVFLMARPAYTHVSSRLVKEVCALGGDIRGMVPAAVEGALQQRLQERKQENL